MTWKTAMRCDTDVQLQLFVFLRNVDLAVLCHQHVAGEVRCHWTTSIWLWWLRKLRLKDGVNRWDLRNIRSAERHLKGTHTSSTRLCISRGSTASCKGSPRIDTSRKLSSATRNFQRWVLGTMCLATLGLKRVGGSMQRIYLWSMSSENSPHATRMCEIRVQVATFA